jgi:hypothetical protein
MGFYSIVWLTLQMFFAIFRNAAVSAFWDMPMQDTVCSIGGSIFFSRAALVHPQIDIDALGLRRWEPREPRTGQRLATMDLSMFDIFQARPGLENRAVGDQ